MKPFPQTLLSLRWLLLCWTSARLTASETQFSMCMRDSRCFKKKNVLTGIFNGFSKTFSIKTLFIEWGTTKVIRISGNSWRLSTVKPRWMIYVSRRNKIEGKSVCEAASVWHCNVRSWLREEFGFYRLMNDLGQFCDTWTIRIYFVLSLLTSCTLHISSRSDCTAAFIYYFKRCFVFLWNCK